MRTFKFKLYALEIILVLSLFFALFALNIDKKLVVMITLVVITILSLIMLPRKKNKSSVEKQVSILMLIFAVIYLGLFYLLGLHFGFVKSKYIFSLGNLVKTIIPTGTIIVFSELLRKIFLSQDGVITVKGKKYNFSITLVYIAMTLIDVVVYTGIYDLTNMDDFLMVVGFILFSSLSCNLLYNYICNRYGYKPFIIFRLLTGLYMYIIPFIPDVYIFMRTFLRMLSPFIIYLILENTYAKSFYRNRHKNIFGSAVLLVLVTLLIMLISCQFKFGIIVIGSDSMTGTINRGDAVIFERYEGQLIDVGQVVMFEYNDIKTVHRIVGRQSINGEVRYYTKGDSNKKEDSGYRVADNIDGIVKLKIKYIGLPTLWFRSLFGK
jgi:signal peptidase I